MLPLTTEKAESSPEVFNQEKKNQIPQLFPKLAALFGSARHGFCSQLHCKEFCSEIRCSMWWALQERCWATTESWFASGNLSSLDYSRSATVGFCHSLGLKEHWQGSFPVPVHCSGDDGQNRGPREERADPGLLTCSSWGTVSEHYRWEKHSQSVPSIINCTC